MQQTWPGCHRYSTPIPGGAQGLWRGVLWGGHVTVEESGRCGLSCNLSTLTTHFLPTSQAEIAWRSLERGLTLHVPSCPQEAAVPKTSQGAGEDTHSPSPALAWSGQYPECRSCTITSVSAGFLSPLVGTQDWREGVSLKLAAPSPSVCLS